MNKDSITGLTSRQTFHKLLMDVNERSSQGDLLVINLKNFRAINDQLGFVFGDLVLEKVASVLRGNVAQPEFVVHIAADEFAIISLSSPNESVELARRLLREVEALNLTHNGYGISITISIGIAKLDINVKDVESIYRRAESACRLAKSKDHDRIIRADENAYDVDRDIEDAKWSLKILNALKQDQMVLMGQPIVGLATPLSFSSIEILVRMLDENGKVLAPALFLPVAERFGMMPQIDEWVVRKSMQWLGECPDKSLRASINLSPVSFTSPYFQSFLIKALRQDPSIAKRITFELTEGSALGNIDKARTFMLDVIGAGSRFALDDFGAGFSNYAMLGRLPLKIIKLDGSLIQGLKDDQFKQSIVRSFTRLAHEMKLKVVAEYVDSFDVLEWLRNHEVDFAQGFYCSPPRHLEFYEVVNANNRYGRSG
ncbi:EAL domain-containing protein [Pseudomonas luteola]